ncbi:MAG: RAMP superfamily CRISPR-associated protein [Thermodesulforhabdaceae bacterium]
MSDRSILLRRRFRTEKIEIQATIITPMFLGDAKQAPSLRPEPFKALLRYWWRLAASVKYPSHGELLEAENKIFGGSGGEKDEWGKSLVVVTINGFPRIGKGLELELKQVGFVKHPEVERSGGMVNPLLYLGYGCIRYKKEKGGVFCNRKYFKPGGSFTIFLSVSSEILDDKDQAELFKTALYYFRAFAAAGSRSRNGWGSLQIAVNSLEISQPQDPIPFTEKLFEKDYPHAPLDGKGFAIWRTKNPFDSWQDVMKELAQIYINVRTSLSLQPKGNLAERHLLGIPVTNHHPVAHLREGDRHASPLRLLVRKQGEKYYGFIVHIPFGMGLKINKNPETKELYFSPAHQLDVWKKVYEKLDSENSVKRVNINELAK